MNTLIGHTQPRCLAVLVTLAMLMLSACHSDGLNSATATTTTLGYTAPVPTGEAGPRPDTIPALREWSPANGTFSLQPGSRIVLGTDDARLHTAAATFAADLRTLTGQILSIVQGGIVQAGDIEMDLQADDPELGTEGYRLSIGPGIVISANSAAGAFYGTRTLLQLLHQNASLSAGIARDWPRYPERSFMVDLGRKYFTPQWLQRRIKEMAYLKMNQLHLHLSDNEGFRVESESHPEIVSKKHLSKDDVRALVALASRYFITVVPEIDMPAHMGAALAPHPELQLKSSNGQASSDLLDVTKPAARQFARDLIEEYLPLFPGKYWHAGGDEYLAFYNYPQYPQLQAYAQKQYGASANGRDAVFDFINWENQIVRAHGKTLRVWGDGLDGGSAVHVDTNVVVEWWTDISPLGDLILIPSPQELLNQGYQIFNASDWPTYLTYGGAGGIQPPPDMATAYTSWNVNQFAGAVFAGPIHTPYATVAADEPRNLGTELHAWLDGGDAAATEEQVGTDIAPRLRVIAQKAWDSPLLTHSYANFQTIMAAVGDAPDGK